MAAREYGLTPRAFPHRDVLTAFLIVATAANVYTAWLVAAHGGPASGRLSALLALGLVTAGQLAVAFRPGRRGLDLVLISCTPYVYLFALYIAALALNSHALWLL